MEMLSRTAAQTVENRAAQTAVIIILTYSFYNVNQIRLVFDYFLWIFKKFSALFYGDVYAVDVRF